MSRRSTSRRCPLPLVLLPLAAIALSAAAPQTDPPTTVRARMERAIALLAAEEADRAIPILLSVVNEVAHHGPARFQLGALAVERGEWAVAADHLEAAVASYGPDAPEGAVPVQRPGLAWALYSDALRETGRLEEALEATARSLRIAPDYLPALLGRSGVARRLAREEAPDGSESLLEAALDAARRAQRLAPERPGPWTALALAARDAGATYLARCAAQEAAELASDDARAWFLVAWTSSESDPEGALAAAETALAAGLRDDPLLWMTLGGLRAFRLDMDASLDAYRKALRLDAAVAGEMASVALDAIVAAGDEELLGLLRNRAARRPDALNTRFALAKDALRAGSVEDAVGDLTRLAELAPRHAAILTSLHAALRRAGDAAAAAAVLVRLEEVKAVEAEAWERANRAERERARARELAAAGEFAEAVRHWQTVLRVLPGNGRDPVALAADWTELGHALEAQGRRSEALTAFGRSLALRPFDSETLSAAARAARAAGQGAEADRYAARAVLTAPDCR